MSRDGVVGGASVIYILQRQPADYHNIHGRLPRHNERVRVDATCPPLHCVIYIYAMERRARQSCSIYTTRSLTDYEHHGSSSNQRIGRPGQPSRPWGTGVLTPSEMLAFIRANVPSWEPRIDPAATDVSALVASGKAWDLPSTSADAVLKVCVAAQGRQKNHSAVSLPDGAIATPSASLGPGVGSIAGQDWLLQPLPPRFP